MVLKLSHPGITFRERKRGRELWKEEKEGIEVAKESEGRKGDVARTRRTTVEDAEGSEDEEKLRSSRIDEDGDEWFELDEVEFENEEGHEWARPKQSWGEGRWLTLPDVHDIEEQCDENNSSAYYTVCPHLSDAEFARTSMADIFAYKKVATRVKPLLAELPEEFRIVRRHHPNPLANLKEVPLQAPDFVPGSRFTLERYENMKKRIVGQGFLTKEETDIALHLIKVHEFSLAWTEGEKGSMNPEYFDLVVIPTIAHKPWVTKNMKIPPGQYDQIIQILKDKLAAGVYEPSNASHRSPWFTVLKKDGKSLRLVHNLQPLNKIAIRDMAVPPYTEDLAEAFAGRACYGAIDLFIAFDQRKLAMNSRDFTTFQTPLGVRATLALGDTRVSLGNGGNPK